MNKKMISVFSMLLFLLMACQPTTPEEVVLPPTATVPSPDMIINDAIDAWNAGDVATLKTLFAGDAVVCFPDWGDECTTGTEEIGAWIEELVAANFIIEPESLETMGDTVTVMAKVWADPTRELGIAPLVTTDVYAVQDGKITSQTSTLTEESSTKLMSAMAAAQTSGVVMAFSETINAGDLDAVMSMYADNLNFEFNPILLPGFPNPVGGKDEVKVRWEELLASNLKRETEITSEMGNIVTTKCTVSSDYLSSLGIVSTELTEEIVVQDGKIKSHMTSIPAVPLNKLQEALVKADIHETIIPEPGEVRISQADDLVGKWLGYLGGERGYLILEPDGSYQIRDMDNKVGDKGDYWFENQLLLLETNSPNLYCDKGNASYVVYTSSSVSLPNQLTFHKIIDLCKLRSTFMTEETFTFEE